MRRTRMVVSHLNLPSPALAGVVALVLGSCWQQETDNAVSPPERAEDQAYRNAYQRMLQAESLIRDLTEELVALARGAENLSLPDASSSHLFAEEISRIDLTAPKAPWSPALNSSDHLKQRAWGTEAASQRVTSTPGVLWAALFRDIHRVEHPKFKVKRGEFLDDKQTRFETEVLFRALAHGVDGQQRWLKGLITVTWSKHSAAQAEQVTEDAGDTWRITGWSTRELVEISSDALLFEEVLASRVAPDVFETLQTSIHESYVLEAIRSPETFAKPTPFFSPWAFDRHPGVSVVDIDGDGWDDLYVMARWGKNQLLRNRGDGTFEEVAATWGLDLADHTSSAIFADFDNDGDPDAFLGRTLARSLYLENVGGHFVDRSDELPEAARPFLVSSVSAVDYDRDGHLDVFLSRYATAMSDARMRGAEEDYTWQDVVPYLSPEEAAEMQRRKSAPDFHLFRNLVGPKNVLLRNTGDGRFVPVQDIGALAGFKNTFQTTWSDIDGDGDQDAYVVNDFSPNHMVRNDNGVFVDLTATTGTADIGFGMGASWGDYDSDGALDLYVSNMYSKAGTRITGQLTELDPQVGQMARGNSLFRKRDHDFERVSGLEPPALLVERVGWSWGSQFVDLNNDGDLDLYALSGFYTAPPEVAVTLDI